MKNIEHKNDDGKRYLKKYKIVETDVKTQIMKRIKKEGAQVPDRAQEHSLHPV